MNDIDILVQRATADFQAATLSAELENAKARYLGKGGLVTELLKGMAELELHGPSGSVAGLAEVGPGWWRCRAGRARCLRGFEG